MKITRNRLTCAIGAATLATLLLGTSAYSSAQEVAQVPALGAGTAAHAAAAAGITPPAGISALAAQAAGE